MDRAETTTPIGCARRVAVLFAAALALMLPAPPAGAAERIVAISAQRPLDDAEVSALVELGRRYWAGRGVGALLQNRAPAVFVADIVDSDGFHALMGTAMAPQIGDREIVIDRRYLYTLRYARSVNTRRGFCAAVVHEVDHVGGLAHTISGLMAPSGGGVVPRACARRYRKPSQRSRMASMRALPPRTKPSDS